MTPDLVRSGPLALIKTTIQALRRRLGDRLIDRNVARMRTRPRSRAAAGALGARLINLGRFEDADAVLEPAIMAWPGRADLLDLYAMSAHVSGRHRLALARWEETRRVEPGRPMAWCGLSSNHRVLEQLGPAEATIREALQRFPDDLIVAGEAAYVFDRLGRNAEAAAQWRRLLDLVPVHQDWYQGYAYSLIQIGKLDEAEAVLDRAAEQYPDDRDLLSTRALLEMERSNWNVALALWRVYRARYPNEQAGWEGQGKTIAAIHHARAEADDPSTDAVKVEIEAIEDDETRSLLLGFESIGADCEFGLVQRRFGAEPLGLLRFNDVRLPSLMAAVGARFERMGDPDLTDLFVSNSGEFYVTDKRWGLGMHTFMFASRHDATTLLPKMCRRVAYLRDKLLSELGAAEKVFVFKSDAIDLDGLRALHLALRAHGPVRLLHVRQASVPLVDQPFDVRPGQVFLLERDLYVGFLGRMGNARLDWNIAFDEWIEICGGLRHATDLPISLPLYRPSRREPAR